MTIPPKPNQRNPCLRKRSRWQGFVGNAFGFQRRMWQRKSCNVRKSRRFTQFRGDGPKRSYGGEGGIRTPGSPKGTTDFESAPFGHSGTSPRRDIRGGSALISRRRPRKERAMIIAGAGCRYPRLGSAYSWMNTRVPTRTRLNSSMICSLRMRMHPRDPGLPMPTSAGQPWM